MFAATIEELEPFVASCAALHPPAAVVERIEVTPLGQGQAMLGVLS